MRWVFRIIGALGAAILLAVGLLLLLPGDKIARIAAEQIKAQTGRDLTFQGDVTVIFWPVLGIETGPVTLGNADWAGPDPMFQAQSLSIGVAARDLMFGSIRIKRIVADAPNLRLQTNADGRGNWQFGLSAPPADTNGAGGSTPITLERLNLRDARLTYVTDGAAPVVLKGVDLALDWPKADGPADIVAILRPADEPIEIVAQVTQFAQFLKGKISTVTASITVPDGRFEFDGRASNAGDAVGHITLQSKNTARVLAAVGLDGIELPQDLGRMIEVAGEATYTSDGRISLRDMSLDIDGNALSGAVDIVLGGVPNVTARLNAGALDFSQVTQFQSQKGDGASDAEKEGWSGAPIDAGALGWINGSVKLTAQSILTSTTQFGMTQVAVRLDRSRAVMELEQAAIFGGSVRGKLVVNNRNGLSVRGNLQASGIAVQKALQDMAGVGKLSGTTEGHIEFLGVGESLDEIMNSLNGTGGFAIQQGVIRGLDLDHLLRADKVSGGTTVFDSITATFTLNDGDLLNDDLVLTLAKFKVEGAGRIGLGKRDIDYVITRVALADELPLAIALPVRINGPWSNLSVRPDLEAAVKAGVDVYLNAHEQEAKGELQGKLEDELDVTIEEGEDVEEVLKDKLEDKAKKGLLKLLGRD